MTTILKINEKEEKTNYIFEIELGMLCVNSGISFLGKVDNLIKIFKFDKKNYNLYYNITNNNNLMVVHNNSSKIMSEEYKHYNAMPSATPEPKSFNLCSRLFWSRTPLVDGSLCKDLSNNKGACNSSMERSVNSKYPDISTYIPCFMGDKVCAPSFTVPACLIPDGYCAPSKIALCSKSKNCSTILDPSCTIELTKCQEDSLGHVCLPPSPAPTPAPAPHPPPTPRPTWAPTVAPSDSPALQLCKSTDQVKNVVKNVLGTGGCWSIRNEPDLCNKSIQVDGGSPDGIYIPYPSHPLAHPCKTNPIKNAFHTCIPDEPCVLPDGFCKKSPSQECTKCNTLIGSCTKSYQDCQKGNYICGQSYRISCSQKKCIPAFGTRVWNSINYNDCINYLQADLSFDQYCDAIPNSKDWECNEDCLDNCEYTGDIFATNICTSRKQNECGSLLWRNPSGGIRFINCRWDSTWGCQLPNESKWCRPNFPK